MEQIEAHQDRLIAAQSAARIASLINSPTADEALEYLAGVRRFADWDASAEEITAREDAIATAVVALSAAEVVCRGDEGDLPAMDAYIDCDDLIDAIQTLVIHALFNGAVSDVEREGFHAFCPSAADLPDFNGRSAAGSNRTL